MLGAIGGFQGGVNLTNYVTQTYLTTNYISITNLVGPAQAPAVINSQYPQVAGVPTFTDFSDRRYWMPCYPGVDGHGLVAFNYAFQAGGSLAISNINSDGNLLSQFFQAGVLGLFKIGLDATGKIIVRLTMSPCSFPINTTGAAATGAQAWGIFMQSEGMSQYIGGGVRVTEPVTNNNAVTSWFGTINTSTITYAVPTTSFGAGVSPKPSASCVVEITITGVTNGGGQSYTAVNTIKHNTDGAGFVTSAGGPTINSGQDPDYFFMPFLGVHMYGRNQNASAVLAKFEVPSGILL